MYTHYLTKAEWDVLVWQCAQSNLSSGIFIDKNEESSTATWWSSGNICSEKDFSITNKFLKRQNRILKESTDGQLTSVISVFNKSQKAQKIPKY